MQELKELLKRKKALILEECRKVCLFAYECQGRYRIDFIKEQSEEAKSHITHRTLATNLSIEEVGIFLNGFRHCLNLNCKTEASQV